MTIRRATGFGRKLVARAPFESVVVALAALYVALHLSPSSYALSPQQLGADETPLLGTPRGIRSDEWAVMTPLFQAAVNNDFQEVNETSFYGETLRSFVGLPLVNWGLLFKPLVWPVLRSLARSRVQLLLGGQDLPYSPWSPDSLRHVCGAGRSSWWLSSRS